jgi:hypothetical protein
MEFGSGQNRESPPAEPQAEEIPDIVKQLVRDAYDRIKANPKDREAIDTVFQYESAVKEGLNKQIDLEPSPVKAFIRNYGKAATADLSTTLGATRTVEANAGLERPGLITPNPDAARAVQAETGVLQAEHPIASNLGTVAGYVGPGGLYTLAEKFLGRTLANIGVKKGLAVAAGGVGAGVVHEGLSKTLEAKSGLKSASEAADEALNNIALNTGVSASIPILGKVLKSVTPSIKSVAGYAGKRAMTGMGISQEAIEAFAKNPKEVSQMIKAKMSEFLPKFADDVNAKISDFVSKSNERLDIVVGKVGKPQELNPILRKAIDLRDEMASLESTDVKSKAIKMADRQIERLKGLGDNGKVSATEMLQLKRDFQDSAKSYYNSKEIGSDKFGSFMAELAGEADSLIDRVSPEVAKINNDLRTTIRGQEALGMGSVFKSEGKMDGVLAERVLRNMGQPTKQGLVKDVEALDKLVGTDILQASSFYRASKELGNPDILSSFKTGRSSLLLNALPGPLKPVGLVLQSPAMARPYIKAATLAGKILDKASTPAAQELAIPGLYGKLREDK